MDSDAAPECDLSLSAALRSHDVESEEGRRRQFRRDQIAVLILSRFLLQLCGSRSSPLACSLSEGRLGPVPHCRMFGFGLGNKDSHTPVVVWVITP